MSKLKQKIASSLLCTAIIVAPKFSEAEILKEAKIGAVVGTNTNGRSVFTGVNSQVNLNIGPNTSFTVEGGPSIDNLQNADFQKGKIAISHREFGFRVKRDLSFGNKGSFGAFFDSHFLTFGIDKGLFNGGAVFTLNKGFNFRVYPYFLNFLLLLGLIQMKLVQT